MAATTAQQPLPSELGGFFRPQRFVNGQVIYRPSDPADRLLLVRNHRVRLLRPAASAATDDKGASEATLHAILAPGALFGDALRVGPATMEEYAVAAGPVEVWSLGRRELHALAEARPALLLELMRGQAERMRRMRRSVFALGSKEVPARVAEVLLELGESLGERSRHGAEVDLQGVTQQDLADLVGASRSFVSTLVNEFKRKGLVGSVGRTLLLRDQSGLRLIAEGAPFETPGKAERAIA